MGLQGIIRGKPARTTVSDKAAPCPLDRVNRQFHAPAPNRLWVSDFTYVSTWTGMVYVAFVIDIYAKNANVIVAGDFNRVMEFSGDQFWPGIDDGKPAPLELYCAPLCSDLDETDVCVDRPLQIDHIVFPKEVFDGTAGVLDYEAGTFRRLPIPGAAKKEREKLSDHCPEWGDFAVK